MLFVGLQSAISRAMEHGIAQENRGRQKWFIHTFGMDLNTWHELSYSYSCKTGKKLFLTLCAGFKAF